MCMDLSSRDRKQLKGLAHHLDAVVRVGRVGVTDGVLAETNRALEAHELIKIRIESDDGKKRREMADRLAEATAAALVGVVGKIAILYRPDPEKPTIRLKGTRSR